MRGAVAGLLGAAPGRITLHDEELGARRTRIAAIGELAGKAQLARRRLARDLLLGAPAQALLCALDKKLEKLRRLRGEIGEEMVEGIADRAFDDTRCLGARELVLGLALELRLADEHRQHGGARDGDVVGGDDGATLVADALGMIAQGAQEGEAQPLLMRPAIGGWNGVAIG